MDAKFLYKCVQLDGHSVNLVRSNWRGRKKLRSSRTKVVEIGAVGAGASHDLFGFECHSLSQSKLYSLANRMNQP